MASIQPGLESNVYKFDAKRWNLKERRISESPIAAPEQAPSASDAPDDLEQSQESFMEGGGEPRYASSVQIYSKIDSAGWWNFDKPHDQYTCLRGRLSGAPAGTVVQAIGLDYFGISYGSLQGKGNFALNALKNKKVKILAVRYPSEKNQPVWLGHITLDQTPDFTAFVQGDAGRSACKPIGALTMKPYPASILKDRAAFLKAIDMRDI